MTSYHADSHEHPRGGEQAERKGPSTQEFSLLCGDAMGNFYKGAQQQEICDHHTHVVSEDGTIGPAVATL